MYSSRECAELDGKTHSNCRDPDCECKHSQCQETAIEGNIQCTLHEIHTGPHICNIEWNTGEL